MMFKHLHSRWRVALCALLLVSGAAWAQTKPNVLILATGGTIAGAGA